MRKITRCIKKAIGFVLRYSAFSVFLVSAISFSAVNNTAVNLPGQQKVLLIMGQDTTTLREYKSEVLDRQSDMPKPGGVTLYTSILPTNLDPNNTAPSDASLYVSGIEGKPADTLNGEVNFHETLAAYDAANNGNKVALAVGLYLSDEWSNCANQPLRAIIGGQKARELSGNPSAGDDVGELNQPGSLSLSWNQAVRRMITWFKNQGRPVYLRIGYEFDGPWNCYNQDFYKAAFVRIKQHINELNATNVATVWQAATYPDDGDVQYSYAPFATTPRQHYDAWYPLGEGGLDNVVDWVGVSYFSGPNYLEYQWSCQDSSKPWTVPEGSPRVLQDTLLQLASDYGKPVLIAESAPQGFDLVNKTWSCVAARQDHLSGHRFNGGQDIWNAWYSDFFSWVEQNRNQIRAVAYINADWQSQGRWACVPASNACSQGYWGVTSIQDDQTVLNNFKQEAKKSYYVNGGLGPQPTGTPSPTSTPWPSPSSTPIPTSTPLPTSTPEPSFCPNSHPFYCGGACYENAQQAASVGCQSGNPMPTPPPAPSFCPISHTFECGGACYEDASQAEDGGCVI